MSNGTDIYSPFHDPTEFPREIWLGAVPSTDNFTSPLHPQLDKFRTRFPWDLTNKHFTFEYKQREVIVGIVTLRINPEEFTQTEPKRVNITQTKGGAFVEHFGEGLKTITMRGVTGYQPKGVKGYEQTGRDAFLELRQLIRLWSDNSKQAAEENQLKFINNADGESYEVAVTNFTLLRAVGRPLLYQYNIQMTVIKDLDIKQPAAELLKRSDLLSNLLNPEKRLPYVLDSLKKGVGFIKNLIMKTLSLIPPISDSSMVWGEKISGGGGFFDSTSGIFSSIHGVVSEVEDISKDVETCVSGASALITRPFELIQDTAERLSGAISTMCASAMVPHEIIRSFREMYCALKSMPKSLFMGFTNPSLFEGASSCGTTLGVEEASVSGWRNSFSATSQIAIERLVNKVFYAPELTITLPEVPIKVKGVYLLNDTERTGTNYLDSVFGPVVRLAKIPLNPVVVDYSVQQATTRDMIKLKTASGYVVKRGDTPQSIAQSVYWDASRWKEIILYNNLEFPYITDDINTVKEFKAVGVVTFYRQDGYVDPVLIPFGHGVYVPKLMYSWAKKWATDQINFATTESKLLDVGVASIDVGVGAEISGDIGNVASELITGFDALTGIGSVVNSQPTGGGKNWRVVEPGDVIQIPKTETDVTSIVVSAKSSYEELFGIDVLVNSDGEMVSGSDGDISRVFGVKNLAQALRNRIYTKKSYYPYHPEYGADLPYYIGRKGTTGWINLVKVDIVQACLLDPRLKRLKDFLMEVAGDSISIHFDAIPIDEQIGVPINLVL